MQKLKKFAVEIDKPVYVPGQIIAVSFNIPEYIRYNNKSDNAKGNLLIENENEFSSKNLVIKLCGKSVSTFITKKSLHQKLETKTQLYVTSRNLIWGNIAESSCTPVENGIADFEYIGSSEVGVIRLLVNNNIRIIKLLIKGSNGTGLVDKLCICEKLIELNNEDNCQDVFFSDNKNCQATISINLEHDKLYTSHVAYTNKTRNKCLLKVKVKRITGLENINSKFICFQVIAGNQLMEIDSIGTTLSDDSLIFPPSSLIIPFQFQLPTDLPSSFYIDHQNYITYNIYAKFDIGTKLSLSCRKFFTIIRPSAVAWYMRPIIRELRVPFRKYLFYNLLCGSWEGESIVTSSLMQSAYVPGDVIQLHFEYDVFKGSEKIPIEGNCSKIEKINLYLNRIVQLTANDQMEFINTCIVSNLNVQYTSLDSQVIEVVVPVTPPSYEGGIGKSDSNGFDPIIWRYELLVEVFITRRWTKKFIMKFPVVIGSVGLHILPELSTDEFWQQQHTHHSPARPSAQVLYKADHFKLPDTPMTSMVTDSAELVAPVVNWRDTEQLTPEVIERLLSSETRSIGGSGTIIKDPIEDFTVHDLSLLTHLPVYFVSK